MNKLLLFILIFIISSCKNELPPQKSNVLIGDWISEFSVHTAYGKENHKKNLSFLNDSIGSNFYGGRYAKYEIKDSLLTFYHPKYNYKDYIRGGDKYIYKIRIINKDSLVIKPISKNAIKDYHSYNSLSFKKIQIKNNYNYKRIGFYCTGCYGSCPSLYIEIDQLGNILFNGIRYTEKKGFFSGKLDPNILKLIINKVNFIDWSKIEKSYSANYTDAATCKIQIQFKNKLVNCSLYGTDKEPIELDNLFLILKESYKFCTLKVDTLASTKIIFKDLAKGIYLPQLPPPPDIEIIEVIE